MGGLVAIPAPAMVVQVQGTNLRLATETLARLERWCRGDSDTGDARLLRATGATA
jgi:hypothetical protein